MCVLVGWCSVSCLVSQSVGWSVSTYSDIAGWNRAATRVFSGRLGASRPAARRLPRGHEELNVTGRRVQTGLDDQSGANKTFRHGRCQRAAGARARPCHYTLSLSARDRTRRGRIRAAQSHGDNRVINSVVINGFFFTVAVTIVALDTHTTCVKFSLIMTSLG